MIILGLNCAHDGTAALLVDGEIVAAVAEERLSRKKYHLGFPYRAVSECLRIAGVRAEDVAVAVIPFARYLDAHPFFTGLILARDGSPIDVGNEMSLADLFRGLWPGLKRGGIRLVSLNPSHPRNAESTRRAYLDALRSVGVTRASLETVEHHKAHAASAYYTSGFDPALVLTVDGRGDGLSATSWVGQDGALTRIAETADRYSPGVFYSAVTKFLGFKRHRHEGKVTGLAAYGHPERWYHVMKKVLTFSPEARGFRTELDYDFSVWRKVGWLPRLVSGTYFRSQITNFLLDYFRKELNGAEREDVAAAAQRRLEDCLVEYAAHFIRETGLARLAMAGGVFANVRVNQKILEIPGVQEVFIHPNMGDGGTAVGGALAFWHEKGYGRRNGRTCKRLQHVYLGPEYGEQEIAETLRRYGLGGERPPDLPAAVARLLTEKRIVGWFQGRVEYGPRALGNRSILAEASDRSINDWLNERLHRTEFMPFAPSLPIEDARRYHSNAAQGAFPAEFMTITFDVTEEAARVAPAVCHVDRTARPQVVREEINPMYYRVLREYEKLAGHSIIVNTSFNAHEEPIVCTPDDAVRSLLAGSVDVLAIGPFLVNAPADAETKTGERS